MIQNKTLFNVSLASKTTQTHKSHIDKAISASLRSFLLLLPGADWFGPGRCLGNSVCILVSGGLDFDFARLPLLLLLAFSSTSRAFALVLLHDLFGQLFILLDNPTDLARKVLLLLLHLSDNILKLLNVHSHEGALLIARLLLRLWSGGWVHLINLSSRRGAPCLVLLVLSSRSVWWKGVMLILIFSPLITRLGLSSWIVSRRRVLLVLSLRSDTSLLVLSPILVLLILHRFLVFTEFNAFSLFGYV